MNLLAFFKQHIRLNLDSCARILHISFRTNGLTKSWACLWSSRLRPEFYHAPITIALDQASIPHPVSICAREPRWRQAATWDDFRWKGPSGRHLDCFWRKNEFRRLRSRCYSQFLSQKAEWWCDSPTGKIIAMTKAFFQLCPSHDMASACIAPGLLAGKLGQYHGTQSIDT